MMKDLLEAYFGKHYKSTKRVSAISKVDTGLLSFSDSKACTQVKYIDPFKMNDGTEKIGKRNTVRIQIENSISLLNGVPELAEAISTKQSKIALFAYRVKPEKTKDAFDSGVSANMKVLGSLNRNLSKTPMYFSMSNGFLFTEIKHPDVYIW